MNENYSEQEYQEALTESTANTEPEKAVNDTIAPDPEIDMSDVEGWDGDQENGGNEQQQEQQNDTASENEGEIPELTNIPAEINTAQETIQTLQNQQPQQQPQPKTAIIPESIQKFLGVKSEADALNIIREYKIQEYKLKGANDFIANKLVDDEMRQFGISAETPEPAPQPQQIQTAEPDEAQKRINRMAEQINYIKQQTGIDMMKVLNENTELMEGINQYHKTGNAGFDIIGAYNRYRTKMTQHRKKIPPTSQTGGGSHGGGRIDVNRLTDAQMEDIERRVAAGERIIL